MITIHVDGDDYDVNENMILGFVLHEIKLAKSGISPNSDSPSGLFCGMGICFQCAVSIDGHSGIRSCMTKVFPGMNVKTDS